MMTLETIFVFCLRVVLVIWQQLRYWRFLAVLVGLPIIRQIAAMVYSRFADYRFAKLAHCQIAQKNLAEAPTR